MQTKRLKNDLETGFRLLLLTLLKVFKNANMATNYFTNFFQLSFGYKNLT